MSILNWQVDSSSNFASFFIVMIKNSPVNFKLIHFLLWIKRSLQSSNFKSFEHSLVKICWISPVLFESTSQFSCKCCINIQYNQAKLTYTFFRSNIIYSVQKKPIKVQIFEIFECSGQHSSNSSCQFWTDKSVLLQILHHLSLPRHITPLKFMNSYIFNFREKYAIKFPIWWLSSALVKICQFFHVNL